MIDRVKLFISVFFQVIGNAFLSKFILLETVKETINFNLIFKQSNLQSAGYLALGSALVSKPIAFKNVSDVIRTDYDECDHICPATQLDAHYVQWSLRCRNLRVQELFRARQPCQYEMAYH